MKPIILMTEGMEAFKVLFIKDSGCIIKKGMKAITFGQRQLFPNQCL
jgi:hypothetical protein